MSSSSSVACMVVRLRTCCSTRPRRVTGWSGPSSGRGGACAVKARASAIGDDLRPLLLGRVDALGREGRAGLETLDQLGEGAGRAGRGRDQEPGAGRGRAGGVAQLGRDDQDVGVLGQLFQRREGRLHLEARSLDHAVQSTPGLQPVARQRAGRVTADDPSHQPRSPLRRRWLRCANVTGRRSRPRRSSRVHAHLPAASRSRHRTILPGRHSGSDPSVILSAAKDLLTS